MSHATGERGPSAPNISNFAILIFMAHEGSNDSEGPKKITAAEHGHALMVCKVNDVVAFDYENPKPGNPPMHISGTILSKETRQPRPGAEQEGKVIHLLVIKEGEKIGTYMGGGARMKNFQIISSSKGGE